MPSGTIRLSVLVILKLACPAHLSGSKCDEKRSDAESCSCTRAAALRCTRSILPGHSLLSQALCAALGLQAAS